MIVLDSLGIGEAPDAKNFGDEGANTLLRISSAEEFSVEQLASLGLGNIDGVNCVEKSPLPQAAVGRLRELSYGKDTTTGHWEISGILSSKPLPTYPMGFPEEIIEEFSKRTGKEVLCNLPYSGTEVINDYGNEHLKSGGLIVYTSADSVFQIAAHEELVPPSELYEYCKTAREILTGEHGVGRVIARPFIGENGNFRRTENRRDFSLAPPDKTMLDVLSEANLDVISVGKIWDIFAGAGITESYHTHNNREGMAKTFELSDRDFHGLCFVNLVDFDMLYGHRQDTRGYANALTEFDRWLSGFIKKLKSDDVLIITADHGCDPGDDSTDHTREFVPLIIFGDKIANVSLGTLDGFANVGVTVCDLLGVEFKSCAGISLKKKIQP